MAKRKKLQDQNPPRRVEIRGQDHLLAYITPEEAQMLMDNGGTGEAGPMGIPTFIDPGAGANNAGAGFGVGVADADEIGDAQAMGGLFGNDPFGISNSPFGIGVNAIGGFLDKAVGLEAHSPGAGGGTGGDGFPETSYMSSYYGNFGGQQNNCPPGYVYNENVGACVKDTGQSSNTPTAAGILQDLPAGAYARMGLLDMAPSGLEDFASRYGMTGYTTPDAFTAQNQAFARQRATYPQFYESPPLMSDLRRPETGDIVSPTGELIPAAAYPVGGILSPEVVEQIAMQTPVVPAPAPVAPEPAPVAPSAIEATPYGRIDRFTTNTGELSPTANFVTDIMGLGIDDPLIKKAQETLGPSGGDPMARALTIAAQMPTPELGFANRGQYLESLGEIGRATGRVGLRIQDDTGRTIGWSEFERPEGDN